MLREIRLYGRLAKFIGQRVLHADVASAAEAVRFLLANFPRLERHMADQHYRVSVGNYDLAESELHDPAGQQTIRIIPVVAGAGTVGRIIAGVALIALAAVFPLGAIGALSLNSLAFGLGASLVLGGVAQLLTPTPATTLGDSKMGSDDPKALSYSFSGVQNTSRPGTPCPIIFGECLVGSVVISAGIDIVQVTA